MKILWRISLKFPPVLLITLPTNDPYPFPIPHFTGTEPKDILPLSYVPSRFIMTLDFLGKLLNLYNLNELNSQHKYFWELD